MAGVAAVGGGVLGEAREQRFDRAVRLRERRRIVRAAQPHDGGLAGGPAYRRDIHGVAVRGTEPRDGVHPRPALLGDHPIHGVAGRRDDGDRARRQVDLAHDVEDLVCTRPDDDLVGADAVAVGRGRDEPSIVGRRRTPTAASRSGPPRGRERRDPAVRARCSGRSGRSGRSARRSAPRPPRRSLPSCTTPGRSAR